MFDGTMQRQVKGVAFAMIAFVAALTAIGAGKTAPYNGTSRSTKQKPASQAAKAPSVQAKKDVPAPMGRQHAPRILIPDMPELKFSNKLATFPVTQPKNAEYYRQQKYKTDRSKYNTRDWDRCLEYDMLRLGGPYVPDIFYEKAQLPYAERIKFYDDPEWQKIMSALDKQFGNNIGKKRLWNGTPLILSIQMLCSEMLTFGRPLASLTTETESAREAVELCGMTQLGNWMDIQKARNREFKDIIPEGYSEKEAREQQKHLCYFKGLFGNQYAKDVGEWAERPIRGDIPYFDEADFAHLTVEKKNELLDLFDYMPYQCKDTPCMDTGRIYALYNEIQADQTGYRYVQQQRPGLSREQAQKVQQLSLEMVIYKRPLVLLRAEDYSLEQVIQVCKLRQAEIYYEKKRKNIEIAKKINEFGFATCTLQANTLINLGKRFNHPDWVEFGREMREATQRCEIIKQTNSSTAQGKPLNQGIVNRHDDTPVIQNQVARVADEPRVRDQSKEDGKSAKAAESSAQKKAR